MGRRLTTILAADVVGFSRLMERDEAGTLAALKSHRKELIEPKAAQYHGRTIKLMGDGALMEFGSVVDAVSFAVEVQSAMREWNAGAPEAARITYRIGINIGDVIVDGADIYGDGVNVAARLEALSEAGGICLSRTVFSHVTGKLNLTFDCLGERQVKNISHPITVYRVIFDDKAAALATPIVPVPIRKVRKAWGAVAAVFAIAVVGGLSLWLPYASKPASTFAEDAALTLPEKPSIAVLPFDNISNDPQQDYFADGITEDLITDLSKLSGIFVISRNSSWSYRGKATKIQDIAHDLGVRYVLEGSVQRQGDALRINAQLIDAIGGHHLWAERYDGHLRDVFALQDNVIRQIVSALAVNLTRAEEDEVERPETDNPLAYDAVLQGVKHLRRDTEDETLRSIELFEKAVELDPDYGRAYAALAAAYWRIVASSWTSTAGSRWERAWERFNYNLARAMEEPISLTYALSAQVLAQQGDYSEAFTEINRAMALAPNDPDNHISKAKILNATGRAAEAEEAARWAMRLDPQYVPDYLRVLALALFHQERYEEAAKVLERVVMRQSDVGEDYTTLVSIFGHLGWTEKVPAMIEQYNALAIPAGFDPLTVQEAGLWWYGDIFEYYEPYRERLQEGLRKAGVPEGAGTDLERKDYLRFIVKSGGEYDVEGATKIDAAGAKALLDRGDVTIVDVRAAVDFGWGHIPDAVNLSLITALSEETLSAVVKKNDEVAFYCHGKHCPYSAYASAKALAWGFTRVDYFAGGFPAWEAAGYPVDVTPSQ